MTEGWSCTGTGREKSVLPFRVLPLSVSGFRMMLVMRELRFRNGSGMTSLSPEHVLLYATIGRSPFGINSSPWHDNMPFGEASTP
jgi:hypothetical protein